MTDAAPAIDRRPGRIAANLGVSRATARALLAIPHELRGEALDELTRVGVGRALAFTRTQPNLHA